MTSDVLKWINSKYPLKYIKIRGKSWEYIIKGSGKKTLLLLPGGGQTAQSNFQLIQAFEKKYTVVSPTIYNVDFIEEFCFAINTILKKEKKKKVILYGLSIGGMMAQSYAKRNKQRVTALIISHSPAPKSRTYRKSVLTPLLALSIFLPVLPIRLIRFLMKRYALMYQGGKGISNSLQFDNKLKFFVHDFYTRALSKRLLYTWIRLHIQFSEENFYLSDFSFLKHSILILRTDNDYLAQDDGEFKKIYPSAKVVTFHGTGHMTFQFQFNKMITSINKFLCGTIYL